MIDLYFGRGMAGRAPLTDAEWAAFSRTQLTPRFPGGFTVIDAQGQWLNPGTHEIGAEASKMVRIAVSPTSDLPARVSGVADAYRKQFRQISVGITSQATCGAF